MALCAVFAVAAAGATRFALTSSAFRPAGPIPKRYTCDGANVSPPLRWSRPPARTRSFAVRVVDPDAPDSGGFTHWLGWNIPARSRGLAQGREAPVEGRNDQGRIGYFGPCPPAGPRHHYRFVLYALDVRLTLRRGARPLAFQAALRGHVLARATLVGTYGR